MDMRIGVDMRISRSCAAHSAIAFARTIYASRTDASQRLVRTTTKEYQTAPQGLIGVRAVTPRMCVVSGWWCRARCAPRLWIVTVLPGRPERSITVKSFSPTFPSCSAALLVPQASCFHTRGG